MGVGRSPGVYPGAAHPQTVDELQPPTCVVTHDLHLKFYLLPDDSAVTLKAPSALIEIGDHRPSPAGRHGKRRHPIPA